jgi:hypothetical protein
LISSFPIRTVGDRSKPAVERLQPPEN